MSKFVVRAYNGCGDHVAALIEAEDAHEALAFAIIIPDFPLSWHIEVKDWTGENTVFEGRPWLLDWEEYDHEYQFAEPRYF
jgi:hypothetical protein